eukprot:m.69576 g.69576  ORF g.69576 m.69576 type:complete len:370 (+) comp7555_c0_seq1:70-1179(+)
MGCTGAADGRISGGSYQSLHRSVSGAVGPQGSAPSAAPAQLEAWLEKGHRLFVHIKNRCLFADQEAESMRNAHPAGTPVPMSEQAIAAVSMLTTLFRELTKPPPAAGPASTGAVLMSPPPATPLPPATPGPGPLQTPARLPLSPSPDPLFSPTKTPGPASTMFSPTKTPGPAAAGFAQPAATGFNDFIPLVVLIDGTLAHLPALKLTVARRIPIVVLEGSGPLANIIAHAWRLHECFKAGSQSITLSELRGLIEAEIVDVDPSAKEAVLADYVMRVLEVTAVGNLIHVCNIERNESLEGCLLDAATAVLAATQTTTLTGRQAHFQVRPTFQAHGLPACLVGHHSALFAVCLPACLIGHRISVPTVTLAR